MTTSSVQLDFACSRGRGVRPSVHLLLVCTLAGCGGERSLSQLEAALQSADPTEHRAALDELVRALGEQDRAHKATRILRRAGKSSIAALVAALDDRSLRTAATDALVWVGSDHPRDLARALEAASPTTRHRLGRVFGRIGVGAVETLIDLLKSDDCDVRAAAGEGFRLLGPTVMQRIEEKLRDESEEVVANAAIALQGLRPLIEGGIPNLVLALASPDRPTRNIASLYLGLTGKDAVPLLIKALDAKEIRVRAVRLLGVLGKNAADALPALQKLEDAEDAGLRRTVRWTLGRIRG